MRAALAGGAARLRTYFAQDRAGLFVLLIATLAVLAHGAWRHAQPAASAAPPEEPAASPPVPLLVRPDLEKAPLSYFSDYWLQLGERARAALTLAGEAQVPALVMAPGLALTSRSAAAPLAAGAAGARLVAVDAERELALIELADGAAPRAFAVADASTLRPGALVAAVSVTAGGRLHVAPGHVTAAADGTRGGLEIDVPLKPSAAPAAVVDLDGRLVAAVFHAGGSRHVLSGAALLRAVEDLRTAGPCRAIEAGDLDPRARALLRSGAGVLVARVRPEAFRGAPPLRAGDVLVRWEGDAVTSAAEFHARLAAAAPGAAATARLLRAGKSVQVAVEVPRADCHPAAREPQAFTALGARLSPSAGDGPDGAGLTVLDAPPGSRAAAAGLRKYDVIEALDGRPFDAARARAAFSDVQERPRTLLLTVRRGGRVHLLVVAPPEE